MKLCSFAFPELQFEPSFVFLASSSRGTSWGEGVGEVLMSARRGRLDQYWEGLRKLRKQIIPLIAAATMEKGAYQRAYPHMIKLHILSELEDMLSGLLQIGANDTNTQQLHQQKECSAGNLIYAATAGAAATQRGKQNQPSMQLQPMALSIRQLVKKWDSRLDLIQTSYKNLEPVLSFRRTLLLLACELCPEDSETKGDLELEIQRSWLTSAKIARKAGMLQQGETAFLHAGNGRDVFIERAKWMQLRGDSVASLDILRRGIATHFPNASTYKTDCSPDTRDERAACARAQHLLAKYSEAAAILDVNSMMLRYRDAYETDRDAEDGHFHFAMYLVRILSYRREKTIEYQYHIVVSTTWL